MAGMILKTRPFNTINNTNSWALLQCIIEYSPMQARSQDFSWGGWGVGGWGGANIKKRDQIINVLILRYATSEDTRGGVSSLRSIKLKSGDF